MTTTMLKRMRVSFSAFCLSWKAALLILLLALAARTVHLTADPPKDLCWSLGVFFDEGVYNHNARNQLLFGEWRLDEWNDFYYSAVSTWMKYEVMRVIGVGRAQIRLISIAYSMASLLFLYLAAKESYGRRAGLIALLLFGANYFSTMYARLGMQDTQTLTIFILGFYCWQRGLNRLTGAGKQWGVWMALAGIFIFLSYTYKNLFLYLLPVPFAAFALLIALNFQHRERRQRLLAAFGLFSAGMGAAFLLWFLGFYLPNREVITQFGDFFTKTQMFPTTNLLHFLKIIYGRPFFSYFTHTPVLLNVSLAVVGILLFLLFSEKRAALHASDLFALAWFFAVFSFTAIIAYRPTRYFLPIIPPMCLLAARGLGYLWECADRISLPQKIWRGGWWIVGGWFAMQSAYALLPLRYRGFNHAPGAPFLPPTITDMFTGVSLSILLIAATLHLLQRGRSGRAFSLSASRRTSIAIALTLASVFADLRWYLRWFRAPEYVIMNTERDIMKRAGDDAYLGGLNALGVAYDTPYKTLMSWDKYVNYRDNPIEKYRLTHLFLGDGAGSEERLYYFRLYPAQMSRATPLAQYLIDNTTYTLFSLVEPQIDILLRHNRFGRRTSFPLSVQVKNLEFRRPRQLTVNWYLYDLALPAGLQAAAMGEPQTAQMSPKETRTFVIPGTLAARSGNYLLMASVQEVKEERYEAELAQSQIGEIARDEAASGGKAVAHVPEDAKDEGFLIYGQYPYAPSGVYEARFRVKALNAAASDQPIFRVEVTANFGETLIAGKDVFHQDLPSDGTFTEIALPFVLSRDGKLMEFRVLTHGRAALSVDCVTLKSHEGVWFKQPLAVR